MKHHTCFFFIYMLLILLKILVTLAGTSQTREQYIVTCTSSFVVMVTLQSSGIMHIILCADIRLIHAYRGLRTEHLLH
jgi:hypothetical protein